LIVRGPRPQGNFYILDKAISEDARLSWGARGLLVFLLGKPDHWQVSPAALANETSASAKPLGRDGVYSLIAELITAGYVRRQQTRKADGSLGPVVYTVSEAPLTAQPDAASPLPAQPDTARPHPANPTQVSIEGKQGLNTDQGSEHTEGEKRARAKAKAPASLPARLDFDFSKGIFLGPVGDHFERWRRAFPAVDLVAEVARAAEWLFTNPKNRKSDYLRFLTNWLGRAQDRAPRIGRTSSAPSSAGRRSVADERADWMNRATGRAAPQGGAAPDVVDVPSVWKADE
jgi:hypothetical protein